MARLTSFLSLLAWSFLVLPTLLNGDEPVVPVAANTELSAEQRAKEIYFRDHILPLFEKHCYECHSHAAGKAQGGLVLDSRSGWSQGGESGPAVIPGKPAESLLIKAVRYQGFEMPPAGKLPEEVIAKLETWVSSGASDPRVLTPQSHQPGPKLDAGKKHWAFQPIRRDLQSPQVTGSDWPRNEIDRYLFSAWAARGLQPGPDADRHTWLRRVSLDLTGLPPTPAEISDFLSDTSSEADERVVDRLLNSRAFAERWARHWLDLVGFADQIGTANDIYAEHAWRYRDYVIESFREDKPFQQFIREQIAGDLLPFKSPEQRASQWTATGFLLLGDLTIVEADKPKLRVDIIDQQVDKIGRAFLGMTLGCSRCHDHKFDPISQRDYYALAGFFHSTESVTRAPWGVWSWPTVVELPESERQQAERRVLTEKHQQRLAEKKADRDRLQAKKAEIESSLARQTPAPPDATSRELLEKFCNELGEQLKRVESEIQHAEFFAPEPPRAFAVRDVAAPSDMQLTIRGNAYLLGDSVPRGFPTVMHSGPPPTISSGESGRRQLADWIADPNHPLTARVAVNRIWQKMFGEGLVRSVDYFGLPADQPAHPELLDYLAGSFIQNHWSQKQFIRSLALSHAYRLSSAATNAIAAKTDPDNRLYWRMNRRRLDAEAIRDGWLLISGRLIESDGGPSLPLEYLENSGGLTRNGVNPPFFRLNRFRPEQLAERTLYLPVIRSGPQAGPADIRNYFDFTQPAEFAGTRGTTAVPTQALFLMNSNLVKECAADLARLMTKMEGTQEARLQQVWLRVFSRPITDEEMQESLKFLAGSTSSAGSAGGMEERWTELCHALLMANECLMRT